MGGTGKTPTVMELAKFFQKKGLKVSILLRGYKRSSKGAKLVSEGDKPLLNVFEAGDEAYLYARLLKGVAVAVAEKRCEGWELLKRLKPDILLLDDAFQHLAIERDFDIVLLTPGDLKAKVFPFGRLREPLASLKRADYCLISKTEKSLELENLCKELGKPFGYLKVVGFKLFKPNLEEVSFNTLKSKKVGIVSALGDNKGFQRQMENLAKLYNFSIEKVLEFPDHYHYRGLKLDSHLIWLTTFKDIFKISTAGLKIYAVDRKVELSSNLLNLLEELLLKMETSKGGLT